jgi:hypothetical protein
MAGLQAAVSVILQKSNTYIKQDRMYKKVSEIIELIERYHKGLSEYFLSLKAKTTDQRVHLLLEFLGKSEAFLAEYLEKYRETTSGRIMNSWVKFVPWLPTDIFCECRENVNLQPPLVTYNVLDAALHFDDCLISFYTTLVQEIQDERVAEIFSNLLRVTKKHEMNLARDISWLHDI